MDSLNLFQFNCFSIQEKSSSILNSSQLGTVPNANNGSTSSTRIQSSAADSGSLRSKPSTHKEAVTVETVVEAVRHAFYGEAGDPLLDDTDVGSKFSSKNVKKNSVILKNNS